MSSSLHLITKFLSEHTEGVTSEINEQLVLFSLRKCEVDITEENTYFLRSLQTMTNGVYQIDGLGSSVYYFKTASTTIQLQIIIGNTIDVQPYIIYNENSISVEIEKVLELDRILYNVLKTKGLQN